jgi:hypothetical protein
VRAAVAASGRPGDELMGLVAPANGRATVERVAANEHGFAAADSTVAVLAAEAPQIVVNAGGRGAREILSTVARAGTVIASPDLAPLGDTLLVIGPEHAATIAADSWSKADARPRRRRHRRPVLGVGAGLAVPRRAVAAGAQARGGAGATIGSCLSPTTRAFGSSSKPIRCPCGCTTSPAWPSSK